MSLRYALLALLRVGPLSGYDLQKQFSLSVGHVWHAPDSQIYPELRRMAEADLIEPEEQVRGERGRRLVYHVTPAGDRAFEEWMGDPLDYQRVREPAYLRAAYLESATSEEARAFFRAHIAHWTDELRRWEEELRAIQAQANPMLRQRLKVTAPEDRGRTIAFKRLAYEGLVSRAEAEIAWADRGTALIDELDADEAVPGGSARRAALSRTVSPRAVEVAS